MKKMEGHYRRRRGKFGELGAEDIKRLRHLKKAGEASKTCHKSSILMIRI
jgi:hypothetical protein